MTSALDHAWRQRRPRRAKSMVAPGHVLVTRYNLPTRFAARAGVDATDPAWLAHRETLFLGFCAPSVARQTVGDFTWMLLVSPATPERFLVELRKHASLVEADSREETIRPLNDEIPDDGRPLITSRLDNDDALAPDYLAKTRRAALAFQQGGRSAVAFTHGVLAEIETMRATSLPCQRRCIRTSSLEWSGPLTHSSWVRACASSGQGSL